MGGIIMTKELKQKTKEVYNLAKELNCPTLLISKLKNDTIVALNGSAADLARLLYTLIENDKNMIKVLEAVLNKALNK